MSLRPTLEGQDLFGLFDLSLLTQNGMDVWLVETVERCAAWFRASGASAFLMDSDGVIRIKAKSGNQAPIPDDAMIEMGEGIAGTVLLAGKPKLLGDPNEDPILSAHGVDTRREIASSMVVPLIGLTGEKIGVMNFSRSTGESPFVESDLGQAAKLGAHVAMAISNARLVVLLQKSLAANDRKKEQLLAVLASIAGMVLVFDSDGQVEGGNPSPGFLMGESRNAIHSCLESGRKLEVQVTDPETDRTWILFASPMRTGGGVLTAQEITCFQRSQEEASRLRRLAEIGQMTAAVAHELRNPLTGIRGAAQLIVNDPSIAGEYAQIILDEAIKMNLLCDEFLDVSRPLKLKLAPHKLSDVVRKVKDLWMSEFESSGVNLELNVRTAEVEMAVDPKRVEQIVHNLLQNALQACDKGGRVELVITDGQLVVSDNGSGMDDETRSRLFAPFFTTKAQGTGLGLCNVRRIVDAHGGSVEVWSEPGKGTRFEVNFRRNAA